MLLLILLLQGQFAWFLYTGCHYAASKGGSLHIRNSIHLCTTLEYGSAFQRFHHKSRLANRARASPAPTIRRRHCLRPSIGARALDENIFGLTELLLDASGDSWYNDYVEMCCSLWDNGCLVLKGCNALLNRHEQILYLAVKRILSSETVKRAVNYNNA